MRVLMTSIAMTMSSNHGVRETLLEHMKRGDESDQTFKVCPCKNVNSSRYVRCRMYVGENVDMLLALPT
jgi:hypothetical protein